MTLPEIVLLALKLSVSLLVFAIGLKTDLAEVLYLVRRPGQLLRSLLAMNLLMPLVAVGMAVALPLAQPVKVMLVAASLSPVPPLMPRKEEKSGGHESYAIGLLFAAACFSVISIPVAVELLERAFGVPLQVTFASVAQIVLMSALGPLALGVIVRRLLKSTAERVSNVISAVASVTLALAAFGVLIGFRAQITEELSAITVFAVVVFVVAGLAIGHLLGGPEPGDRTVLALSTASRHPGMTLAIASANFPEKRAFIAALMIYLIVAGVLWVVYMAMRRRRASSARANA